jgi:hypothetical protein
MPSQRQNFSERFETISSKINLLKMMPEEISLLWRHNLPSTFDSWWSDLSSEFRLMLACLRLNPDDREIRNIADLSRSEIVWPNLLNLVDRHRTAPLIYRNLRHHGKKVPAPIMELLRSRFESNARRGLANAAELVGLYTRFQQNCIPVIPLKGSILASQIYGNLALRHAGDLDLLVAPQLVELADQLLHQNYHRLMPNFQLTPAQRQRFVRLMHHFGYQHTRKRLSLELHWRPFYDQHNAPLDVTRLLSRATAVNVAGVPLPGLSLPDNILYLCGHGGNHFWVRLFWLVDVAEIIRQNRAIDWGQIIAAANAAGLLRQLVLGVVMAHKLLDAPFPAEIRPFADDLLVIYLAQICCRHMLSPSPENSPLPLRFHLFASRIRIASSLPEKLNIVQELLLGGDWMNTRLPDRLFFLHYMLRHPLWLHRKLQRRENK